MKKIYYYTRIYRKGSTGRKGPIVFESKSECISEAIKKCQEYVYKHEDLFYYSIEREIKLENE